MNTNKMRLIGILGASLITLLGCGVSDPSRTPGGSGGSGGTGGTGGTTGCASGCDRGFLCQGSSCVLDATGRWVLRITSGSVSARNASGSFWDADGSSPDPKVCLTINGSRTCTTKLADTNSPVWNTNFSAVTATALQAGVLAEYIDEDFTFDDPICSGTIAVTSTDFASGSWGFSCKNGLGQVSAQLIAQ